MREKKHCIFCGKELGLTSSGDEGFCSIRCRGWWRIDYMSLDEIIEDNKWGYTILDENGSELCICIFCGRED